MNEDLTIKQFLNRFLDGAGLLLIKLVGSRKSFFTLVGKLEYYVLLWLFATGRILDSVAIPILIIFAVKEISIMTYSGFLMFEPIKTEIKIDK